MAWTAGAGVDRRAEQPEDFAASFEAAFARLQVLLELACVSGRPWPARVRVGVREALEFAAANPAAASVLTNGALAEGVDGFERYERLMTYLAGLLEAGRAEKPHGADLPAATERSLAGGIAAIVGNRVDREAGRGLSELVPEVTQFVLTPYLGTEEARRVAVEGD